MADHRIEAIEHQISNAQVSIKFAEALERLKKNKDFKDTILKGYFEEEAIRLVHLKGAPDMQSDEAQKMIITQIDSIGSFRSYLDTAYFKAKMARKTIEDGEAELEAIHAEDEDQ